MIQLSPGETLLHEVRQTPLSWQAGLKWLIVVLALPVLTAGTTLGVIVGVAMVVGAFLMQSRLPPIDPSKGRLEVAVTSRRVVAFGTGGTSQEILLSKVETVQTAKDRVTLIGSGGTKFLVTTKRPAEVRDAVQQGLAAQGS